MILFNSLLFSPMFKLICTFFYENPEIPYEIRFTASLSEGEEYILWFSQKCAIQFKHG